MAPTAARDPCDGDPMITPRKPAGDALRAMGARFRGYCQRERATPLPTQSDKA